MKNYVFLNEAGDEILEVLAQDHDTAVANADLMCASYFAGGHKVPITYQTDYYVESV